MDANSRIRGSNNNMEVIKKSCKDSLQKAGVQDSLCEFYTSAMQYEYDVNSMTSSLKQRLQKNSCNHDDPEHLFQTMRDIIKCYAAWKDKIDTILVSSHSLPRLTFKGIHCDDRVSSLCSIETDQLKIQAGEDLIIIDTSVPEHVKVRTKDGHEGYIPTLSCLLPIPDKSPASTAERLSIQLLVSWTETVRKAKPLIISCISGCIQSLYSEWICLHSSNGRERVTRRLRRIKDTIVTADRLNLSSLHNALFSVESEMQDWILSEKMENLLRMKNIICNLDKTVLCYQTFRKQWHIFRKLLRVSHTPIRLVNSIAALRANRHNSIVKYYELRLTITRNSYTSERVHITRNGVVNFTTQTITADVTDGLTGHVVTVGQIKQTESERQMRYLINHVMDPATDLRVSFAEAVETGLIAMATGTYRLSGSESISIREAIDRRYISVEYQSDSGETHEVQSSTGIVTVTQDRRPYVIAAVIDALTGERLDEATARDRELLTKDGGTYTVNTTGTRMHVNAAIKRGWIKVIYENNALPVEKRYAISHVVDQRLRILVNFKNALLKQLFCIRTAQYTNNITQEKMNVMEAIEKGFVKAEPIINTSDQSLMKYRECIQSNL